MKFCSAGLPGFLLFLTLRAAAAAAEPAAAPLLLLQEPTLNKDTIVFVFAGDLWRVPRAGGDAIRLTSHPGSEQAPHFSPDGTQIAFTADYDGNPDVYVMPAAGGVPTRLTSHPGPDEVVNWTPDGSRILFLSPRDMANDGARLFTVPPTGGFPTAVPLPMGIEGSYSPDGKRLAYVPIFQWQAAWKRYRGGQTKPIWIADLADSSIEKLPRENSNDSAPMWAGDTIYFLSDRDGPVTLFACDLRTKSVKRVVENKDFDLKSASLGPDAIVYEQFGSLHLYDLKSARTHTVNVRVTGDFPEVRPRFQEIKGGALQAGRLSPTGQRAVFELRGEIITAPAEKGDVRNLTRTTGVAERDPSWSPDGKWIAYFSDESGEYALHLSPQTGLGEKRVIALGEPPSFYYAPTWSPDSKQLAFADKRNQLWLLTLDTPTPVLVDATRVGGIAAPFSWSPDSRWLAYAKTLHNRLNAVFVFGLADKTAHQMTDGLSDAVFPAFSADGKYLYFAASTDSGAAAQWGDLSAINRPVTRSVYLGVLDASLTSPLAPESDEEKSESEKSDTEKTEKKAGADEKKDDGGDQKSDTDKDKKPADVKIDFENFTQRILALPMPAKNYKWLAAGKDGMLWVLEGPTLDPVEGPADVTLHKFDLKKRKADKVMDGLREFDLSQDGEKILYRKDDEWYIVKAAEAPKADAKPLNFGGFQLAVDPRAEWRQMFRETWRLERDFFYDPGLHGLDLKKTIARYEPFLENLASRRDLNYLFEDMLGELTVGHMFIRGGDFPEVKRVGVGLLGADYTLENGRYRFARIFSGENWNPQLRAPLTEPGVAVAVGEYLLAVDGRDLTAATEIYALFQDKAERLVTLRVGPNPDGSGARDVPVKPVGDEHGLRNRGWIEANRRKVAELSQGQLAYVYLPDTYAEGYTSFNRYFFAQLDKAGFIIDERFNHGGWLADYVIDYLRRPVMNWSFSRDLDDISSPLGANGGPKVMLINEHAGSGGDALPWYFRKAGIGPLIGKRTWGGLVGIGGYPPLLDGGRVMAPHWAIYGLDGEWEVENRGIAPDIEVDFDPKAWRAGHDPQLEKAIEVALEALRKNPPKPAKRPPFPNYHQAPGP